MTTSNSSIFQGPGPDAVFSAALENGEFKIQQCGSCSAHVFYPRALCTECGSPDLTWVEASGNGVVYATSVVRAKPEHGGDYNIALIELDEGPRMMSRVVDTPPAEVKIGSNVSAFIDELDGNRVVLFRPAEGDGA